MVKMIHWWNSIPVVGKAHFYSSEDILDQNNDNIEKTRKDDTNDLFDKDFNSEIRLKKHNDQANKKKIVIAVSRGDKRHKSS